MTLTKKLQKLFRCRPINGFLQSLKYNKILRMFGKKDQAAVHKSIHWQCKNPACVTSADAHSAQRQKSNQNGRCICGQSQRSTQSRSQSKNRRISAKKLFGKAHETTGQTFLRNPRTQHSTEIKQNRAPASGRAISIQKTKSLMLHKEYDIKVSGNSTDGESSLSRIIDRFSEENGLWDIDLSSICEDKWQTGSELGEESSLIRAISNE